MKVRLLHPDVDAELHTPLTEGDEDLVADLDLQPVLDLMTTTGRLMDIPQIVLRPLTDPRDIRWRQQVVAEAIDNPTGMRNLFDLAGRALERQRGIWMYSARTADSLLSSSLYGLGAVLPREELLPATAVGDRLLRRRRPVAATTEQRRRAAVLA